MPQIFKHGSYRIYFWANENDPLEPIHIHISHKKPSENATKVWITQNGKSLLCHNRSRIPNDELNKLMRVIEANSQLIIKKWFEIFGRVTYYC